MREWETLPKLEMEGQKMQYLRVARLNTRHRVDAQSHFIMERLGPVEQTVTLELPLSRLSESDSASFKTASEHSLANNLMVQSRIEQQPVDVEELPPTANLLGKQPSLAYRNLNLHGSYHHTSTLPLLLHGESS